MTTHATELSTLTRPHASDRLSAAASALALGLCVLLTHPVVEMGISDDWSYIRTALEFARTGHFVYIGWASAMLGWQVVWGALFIKLFGFSFTIVRSSALLIAIACAYLLHRIMVRFGVSPALATLGTLTVVLSPLFLPLAFTFLTDIPGLFAILVCLYACQRAVLATTDRASLAWLCFAAAANVGLGTVRQIAWLGALVMVPSAAWLLRRRRGALVVAAVLWIASLAAILLSTHWFLQQPYSLPEKVIDGPIGFILLARLANRFARVVLTVIFFALPVLAPFLTRIPSPRSRALRIAPFGLAAVVAMLYLLWKQKLSLWLVPWLDNTFTTRGLVSFREILGTRPTVLHAPVRLALTVITVAAGLGLLMWVLSVPRLRMPANAARLSWRDLAILIGPFTLSYLGLLAPRAAFRGLVFDRYLIPVLALATIALLRYYQERVSTGVPASGVVVLLAFTAYAVAGTHDLFAMDRARLAAAEELRHAGVPRTAIQGGVEYDGWTQVDVARYINEPHIRVPAGAYHPLPDPDPKNPCEYWYESYTPAVRAQYLLSFEPEPCLRPSPFPPVAYRTWLPPRTDEIYIEERPTAAIEPRQ